MNTCFISDEMLEKLPEPAQVGRSRVGGIDLNKLRTRRAAEAVLALAASPAGFTAADLAEQVRPNDRFRIAISARRAAYDIKKFQAKGIVRKIERSRRYELVPEGLRALTALLVLREKIIRPLLAASGQPEPLSQPANPTAVDHHYERVRASMRGLFIELGIAA